MITDIDSKLLNTVAEELLSILQRAERHVTDIIEFGYTQGVDEALGEIKLVKNTLIMLGEPAASELCDVISDSIDEHIEQYVDVKPSDISVTFLALGDYIERLAMLRTEGQILVEKQDILHTKAVKYHLSESHKGYLAQAVEQLEQYQQHSDESVIWKTVYPVIKTLKSMVLSQGNYEYLWLIQQLTVRNIKGLLHTPKAETLAILDELTDYLSQLIKEDESYQLYQMILPRVKVLRGMIRDSQLTTTLHEVYAPPPRKLVHDESLISMVFPVSKNTIRTIAFFVKREMAGTARLFEQAVRTDSLSDKATLDDIIQSLKPVSAVFKLLQFDTGEVLINDTLSQLAKDPIDNSVIERFADNMVLLENSLWGLRHIEPSQHLINMTDSVERQKKLMSFSTKEAAVITIADVAVQYFKETRENITEITSNISTDGVLALAERIHDFQSSMDLIGQQDLVANLQKAERFHLFWAGIPALLSSRLVVAAYLESCAAYEIAFNQLNSTLHVDPRAIKLLQQSQRQLEMIAEFDIHRMAEATYRVYGSEHDRLYKEKQKVVDTDDNVESANDLTAEVSAKGDAQAEALTVSKQSLGFGEGQGTGLGVGGAMLADEGEEAQTIKVVMGENPAESTEVSDLSTEALAYIQLNHDLKSLPGEEVDEELLEIFLAEGQRITEQLLTDIQKLKEAPTDSALLKEVERAYHTLKGSGRMVGLNIFGEFAWQHEDFLRHAGEGKYTLTQTAQNLLDDSNHLLKTIFSQTPFVEDKATLLMQAGKIKALSDALSGQSDTEKTDKAAQAALSAAMSTASDGDEASANEAGSSLSAADIQKIAEQVAKVQSSTAQTEPQAAGLHAQTTLTTEPSATEPHVAEATVTPLSVAATESTATSSASTNETDTVAEAEATADATEVSDKIIDTAPSEEAVGADPISAQGNVTATASALKSQLLADMQAEQRSDTEHLQHNLSALQQSIADSDKAASWSNDLLDNLSQTLKALDKAELSLSPSDYQTMGQALDALAQPDSISEQRVAEIQSALAAIENQVDDRQTKAAQVSAFGKNARPELAATQSAHSAWKATGHAPTESLSDLIKQVDSVSEKAKAEAYAEGETLATAVNDVLGQLDADSLVPKQKLAAQIQQAVGELTSDSSAKHGDVSQIPTTVQALQSQLADNTTALGTPYAQSVATLTPSAAAMAAQSDSALPPQHQVDFAVNAAKPIAEAQQHYDSWKGEQYQSATSLSELSTAVTDIQHQAERVDYDDAADLTQSMSEVLSRVDAEQVIPSESVAQSLELGLQELQTAKDNVASGVAAAMSRPVIERMQAQADSSPLGEPITTKAKVQDYVPSEAQTAAAPSQADLATALAALSASPMPQPPQHQVDFATNAATPIDDAKTHYTSWKEEQYQSEASLSQLNTAVGDIHQHAERANYDDAADLTQSMAEVLSRVDDEKVIPSDKVAQNLEQGLQELETAKNEVTSGVPANISRPVIERMQAQASDSPLGEPIPHQTEPATADTASSQTSATASSATAEPTTTEPTTAESATTESATTESATAESTSSDSTAAALAALKAQWLADMKAGQRPNTEALQQSLSALQQFINETDSSAWSKNLLDNVSSTVNALDEAELSLSPLDYQTLGQALDALSQPDRISEQRVAEIQSALNNITEQVADRQIKAAEVEAFGKDARPELDATQLAHAEWQSAGHLPTEPLDNLIKQVDSVSEKAKAAAYAEGETLATAVNDVLDKLDTDSLIPRKRLANQIQNAVGELVSDAHAKHGDLSQIPLTVAALRAQAEAGVELGTPYAPAMATLTPSTAALAAQSDGQANATLPPDYQIHFANNAAQPIDEAQQHYKSWKGEQYRSQASLSQLSSAVTDIHQHAEDVNYDDAAHLTQSMSNVLSRVDKEKVIPSESVAQSLELGLQELDTAKDSVIAGVTAAISQPVIQQIAEKADTSPLGEPIATQAQITAEVKVHAEDIESPAPVATEPTMAQLHVHQSKVPNYQAFADAAAPYIDASYESFTHWKNSQFTNQDSLGKLSGDVQTISEISERTDFESATELSGSISDVLNRVYNEKLRPTQHTVSHVEGALQEFERSAAAIQSGQGDKEIQPQLIQSVNQVIRSPIIGQPLDPLSNIHDLLVKMHSQTTLEQQAVVQEKDLFGFTTEGVAATDEAAAKLQEEQALFRLDDPSLLDNTILMLFIDEAVVLIDEIQSKLELPPSISLAHDALTDLQRRLHTLKGGAKMAGINSLGELAHRSESLLIGISDGYINDLDESHLLIAEAMRIFKDYIQTLRAGVTVKSPLEFFNQLERFIAEQSNREPELLPVATEDVGVAEVANTRYQLPKNFLVSIDAMQRLLELTAANVTAKAQTAWGYAFFQAHLAEMQDTMNRVERLSREIEMTTETGMLSKPADYLSDDEHQFDPLELDRFTTLHQQSRTLAEVTHDLRELSKVFDYLYDISQDIRVKRDNIQDAMQEVVLSMATTDFSSANNRIESMVNQVARRLGKAVNVKIYGAQTVIEKRILDSLVIAIEHAVRNSLAHGIESPEERLHRGKPMRGQITLIIRREGSDVWIMIADDGRGVDIDKVRHKASTLKDFDEKRADDESYILNFLFRAGFTTEAAATHISGRGIGLDVIYEIVKSLNGEAQISSRLYEGFNLAIRVPYGMTITKAIQVLIDDYNYLIPLNTLKGFVRLELDEYHRYIEGEAVLCSYGGVDYRVISPSPTRETKQKQLSSGVPCLLVRVGVEYLAVVVTDILESQDIVIEAGNQNLSQIPGIVGLATIKNSDDVPVLDMSVLGRHLLLRETRRSTVNQSLLVAEAETPPTEEAASVNVLVVDDSITMRKAAEKMLSEDWLSVKTAKNGFDAIDVVKDWMPDVILLDIEMPKMDGFEFAEYLREDEHFKHIPIIIITSRSSAKHKKRAKSLGVKDFMSKPFSKKGVLESINRILQAGESDDE